MGGSIFEYAGKKGGDIERRRRAAGAKSPRPAPGLSVGGRAHTSAPLSWALGTSDGGGYPQGARRSDYNMFVLYVCARLAIEASSGS